MKPQAPCLPSVGANAAREGIRRYSRMDRSGAQVLGRSSRGHAGTCVHAEYQAAHDALRSSSLDMVAAVLEPE